MSRFVVQIGATNIDRLETVHRGINNFHWLTTDVFRILSVSGVREAWSLLRYIILISRCCERNGGVTGNFNSEWNEAVINFPFGIYVWLKKEKMLRSFADLENRSLKNRNFHFESRHLDTLARSFFLSSLLQLMIELIDLTSCKV